MRRFWQGAGLMGVRNGLHGAGLFVLTPSCAAWFQEHSVTLKVLDQMMAKDLGMEHIATTTAGAMAPAIGLTFSSTLLDNAMIAKQGWGIGFWRSVPLSWQTVGLRALVTGSGCTAAARVMELTLFNVITAALKKEG